MNTNVKEMNPSRKRNLNEFKQLSNKVPCKANVNIRWIERITTSYVPSMNFTFDITFPNYKALRFELIPKLIPYVEDSYECLECFMIQSVLPFYSNVLYPGDILLKINGQKCLSTKRNLNDNNDQHNNDKSYLRYLKTFGNIESSDSSITLRFLRSGGNTLNFMLTPSEITLFQSDKHVIAKFIITETKCPNIATLTTTATTLSSNDTNSNLQLSTNKDNDCDCNDLSFAKLEAIYLTFMEQQLPFSVSQMIQGKSSFINWSSIYSYPPSAPAAISLASSNNILTIAPTFNATVGTSSIMDIPVVYPHASLYHPFHNNHTLETIADNSKVNDSSFALDIINMKKGVVVEDLPRNKNKVFVSTMSSKYLSSSSSGSSSVYRDYQNVGASSSIHPTCSWIACNNSSSNSSKHHPYIIGKYDNENLAAQITQQIIVNNQVVKSSFDNLSVMIPSTAMNGIDNDTIIARVIIGMPPGYVV